MGCYTWWTFLCSACGWWFRALRYRCSSTIVSNSELASGHNRQHLNYEFAIVIEHWLRSSPVRPSLRIPPGTGPEKETNLHSTPFWASLCWKIVGFSEKCNISGNGRASGMYYSFEAWIKARMFLRFARINPPSSALYILKGTKSM